MLYNQPLAIRFGAEIIKAIGPNWSRIDFAVAWVRASGVDHLRSSLCRFLVAGGQANFIVGIDLQNTTYEGLASLLSLESYGNAETYVYHNESGSIFHPKLYLFQNERAARLIVGSNNLTESGLFVNVEAGLQIDASVTDTVIRNAVDALESWRDSTSGHALRLDASLLEELWNQGYIPKESDVKRATLRNFTRRKTKKKSLFKSTHYGAPTATGRRPSKRKLKGSSSTPPVAAVSTHSRPATGNVLLMRLRKAQVKSRPTQTQIPFRVLDQFFGSQKHVYSRHTGEAHKLRGARARGTQNTVKLEIPEMRLFDSPVVRFEKTLKGIEYEVHDASSPSGRQIMGALEAGRTSGKTQLTLPNNPKSATWWLYI